MQKSKNYGIKLELSNNGDWFSHDQLLNTVKGITCLCFVILVHSPGGDYQYYNTVKFTFSASEIKQHDYFVHFIDKVKS